MMEGERGVRGVEGRLFYECDTIGRTGDGASWLLGYEPCSFSAQRSIADCISARHTRTG